MIYSTKDLLRNGETEYSIRRKIDSGLLFQIERGYYSDDKNSLYKDEAYLCKKYPNGILTGLSALHVYDLIDFIPDEYHLATKQHTFPIRRKDIKQSYQESSFFELGAIYMSFSGGIIRIYDLERLLIELFRLKEKYPREIFYEAVESYRKIKNNLDFYKLNEYLGKIPNGSRLSLIIKEMI